MAAAGEVDLHADPATHQPATTVGPAQAVGPFAPERRRRLNPQAQIVLFALVLAVASAAALFLAVDAPDVALRESPEWFPYLVGGLFTLSLLAVFHIEFRREALTLSLSEVPIMLALVFVSPVYGVLARLGGSLVWALWRRLSPYKLAFNLPTFTAELVVAHLLMRALVDADSNDAVLVAAAVPSTLAGSVVGSICIAVAVSRFEGSMIRRIVDELKASWIIVVNAFCAALLLGLALVSLPTAGLSVIPIGALWLIMRRHGALAQKLRDLDEVHGFAGRVGRSLDLDEIGSAAVAEVSRLLRAEAAVLVITDTDTPNQMMVHGDFPIHVPADPGHRWWRELIARDERAQLIPGTRGRRGVMTVPETIVAPVDDETGVIGVLLVAGPDGVAEHFGSDDVGQVSNLAEQLAVSLRKGMLHRRIEYEARHDGLTGLPNRNAFEVHLQTAYSQRAPGHTVYLLMLDLDRFKEVNDTLGHHAGDDLLVEFSRRVSARLDEGDFFARLAGDEFAIVAARQTDDDVIELAKRCIEEASRPVTLDGLSIVVTASIGIAELDPAEADDGRAMRRADIAMYNAKSHHLGIEFFRADLDRRTPARLSMLGDLRDAIGQAQLHIEYQPKLDLSSGLVTAAEALVRWNHPVRGAVPPSDFVRVAEETGLIKQLTDLMLSEGIAEVKRLHDRGHHLGLSVNLSTHDLLDAKLPVRVAGYLDAYDVPSHALTLEITESSLLIDAPRTRTTIDELHEMGVRLSIDDFGTGYSSLSYLRQLPVRELKVDQSFVANVLIDSQDEVIVRSTIDLGHNLGLEVVAEGVENNEILDRLKDFGCDMAQGYCISRPLSASRLHAWLNVTSLPSLSHDPLDLAAWEASEAQRWQQVEDRRAARERSQVDGPSSPGV